MVTPGGVYWNLLQERRKCGRQYVPREKVFLPVSWACDVSLLWWLEALTGKQSE
jgi:hypothetical protein